MYRIRSAVASALSDAVSPNGENIPVSSKSVGTLPTSLNRILVSPEPPCCRLLPMSLHLPPPVQVPKTTVLISSDVSTISWSPPASRYLTPTGPVPSILRTIMPWGGDRRQWVLSRPLPLSPLPTDINMYAPPPIYRGQFRGACCSIPILIWIFHILGSVVGPVSLLEDHNGVLHVVVRKVNPVVVTYGRYPMASLHWAPEARQRRQERNLEWLLINPCENTLSSFISRDIHL